MTPEQLAYHAAWRKKNKEHLIEYHRNWAKANPDKVKQKAAKFVKNNPEKNALKSQRYRTMRRSMETFLITSKEINKLYKQPCSNCGVKEDLTIDHIIPLARGGRHSIGNLRTLCRPCNSKKHIRTIMEWRLNKTVKKEKAV